MNFDKYEIEKILESLEKVIDCCQTLEIRLKKYECFRIPIHTKGTSSIKFEKELLLSILNLDLKAYELEINDVYPFDINSLDKDGALYDHLKYCSMRINQLTNLINRIDSFSYGDINYYNEHILRSLYDDYSNE